MRKTLNDIIPPSRRPVPVSLGGSQAPEPPLPSELSGRPRRRIPFVTILIALVVVILSVLALFAFSGARVEIEPSTATAFVSGEFTATASSGDVPFEVIAVEKVGTKSVAAESTETVTVPAQGTITVYNEQSSSQKLIKNTRFETPEGLIFRIRESITIPAAKSSTPGTVSATVYADEAGERYNIGPSSFTLPGLKNGAQYKLVYAKSTGTMSGGFSGTRGAIGKTTENAEHAALEVALGPELDTTLAAQIPEGYVLLPGASFISYERQPDAAGLSGFVDIRGKASASAVIFPEAALAKAIAYRIVGAYNGEPVTLGRTTGMTLVPKETAAPVGAPEFSFSLAGETEIVWGVDGAKIRAAVAGKTRDSAQVVLSGFPEVSRALLVLRPFWESTFPEDPADITVEVKGAEAAI